MTCRIRPLRLPILLAALFVPMAAPAFARAGDLEPPGPPAPTMKTLDEIPPVVSRRLDATNGDADGCDSSRFTCLWGNQAVLDNETGLVWQRTAGSVLNGERTWEDARGCSPAGSRGGWRLPSFHEFASLAYGLPPEAPFTLPAAGSSFWTMTTSAANVLRAWTGTTPVGTTLFSYSTTRKDLTRHFWCVRSVEPLSVY